MICGACPWRPDWLDPREARAWRSFMNAHHRLGVRLNQLLLQDSGLTLADYEVLAVLAEHHGDRMPARELCASLEWEKSGLSHQVRGLQKQGRSSGSPTPPMAAAP